MKRKNILARYYELVNNLNIKEYRIRLDYKYPVGTGYCEDFYNSKREIHIGAKELKGIFNKEVSDKLFTKLIVNIFHEVQHFYQQLDFFKKYRCINDEKVTEFFYNYLACLGGKTGYYLSPYNYFNNPREINAEYVGVTNAYNYLKSTYSKEKAEKMIIDYINDKIGYQYFIRISTPVSSIQEINSIFKDTIKKCEQKKRIYDTNCINDDKAIKYIQGINDEFVLQINDINNGILQDKLVSGVYVKYIEDKNIKTELKQSQIYKDSENSLLNNLESVIGEDKNINKDDYELD